MLVEQIHLIFQLFNGKKNTKQKQMFSLFQESIKETY